MMEPSSGENTTIHSATFKHITSVMDDGMTNWIFCSRTEASNTNF